MKKLIHPLLVLLCIHTTSAQELMTPDSTALPSIDGIVTEILRLLSSENGKSRNLEAIKNLFVPSARLSILNQDDSIEIQLEGVSVDEFIELLRDPYYENGFHEYELGKVVNEYNGIAHVFQSFHAIDSEKEEGKGITSYQLAYFKDRWWIVNLLWTTNSNGVAIPEEYLSR